MEHRRNDADLGNLNHTEIKHTDPNATLSTTTVLSSQGLKPGLSRVNSAQRLTRDKNKRVGGGGFKCIGTAFIIMSNETAILLFFISHLMPVRPSDKGRLKTR
jgi:hypothetical protein